MEYIKNVVIIGGVFAGVAVLSTGVGMAAIKVTDLISDLKEKKEIEKLQKKQDLLNWIVADVPYKEVS